MKSLPMLLVAFIVVSIASIASAGGARVPTTSDEARALAAQRQTDASASAARTDCGRMPTTTDEARATAGAGTAAASAVASRPTTAERAPRAATSTDEARALVAAATNARAVAPDVRRADACETSCACHKAEQHASAAMASCGCHGRT
jgi:hypothetical protein